MLIGFLFEAKCGVICKCLVMYLRIIFNSRLNNFPNLWSFFNLIIPFINVNIHIIVFFGIYWLNNNFFGCFTHFNLWSEYGLFTGGVCLISNIYCSWRKPLIFCIFIPIIVNAFFIIIQNNIIWCFVRSCKIRMF